MNWWQLSVLMFFLLLICASIEEKFEELIKAVKNHAWSVVHGNCIDEDK